MNKMNWPESVLIRFWNKVNIPDDWKEHPEKCWEWTAYTLWDGYGQFRLFGKNIKSSKVSYMIYNGPIPNGMWILHNCDNRLCVNPNHLYLGTRIENAKDVINRNRLKGSKNANSILIEDDIKYIIQNIQNNKYTSYQQISNEYKITRSNIAHILHRRLWKHVTKEMSDEELKQLSQKLNSNKGEKHYLSTLTEEIVKQIKICLKNGEKGCDIAFKFKQSIGTISNIKTGKTWSHITI